MFNQLKQDEFLKLAKVHGRIMVHKEILGDCMTPIHIYHALKAHMLGASLLESSPKEKNLGRYSFLGFTVLSEFKVKNNQITIKNAKENHEVNSCSPLEALRAFHHDTCAYTDPVLSGFVGGIVGFFSFESACLFEATLPKFTEPSDFPEIQFKCYRDHIIFDQKTGQVFIATLVEVGNAASDATLLYQQAIMRLDNFVQEILKAPHHEDKPSAQHVPMDLQVSLDDPAYIAAGQKAKDHIALGDAFQIVLARTFKARYTANPFDIYRLLRLRNPSPYMFYINDTDRVICGASPEKMISVQNGRVQSCPLAGTRPRGEAYCDETQASDLLADTKEVAEHMMLVDLARNDLGRVAKPKGVSVPVLQQIQYFSHVMHISSTVEAELAAGKDALDALCASFPAGTLSGAPKIRAMQIIHELEASPRELYGGVIGFLDSRGNLDSCIAIRMAVLQQGIAKVSAGAGIVMDSDLQKEADETRYKANAILEAIDLAGRGIQ